MIKHLILPKYDGYLRGLALMVYKFFDKKVSNSHRGTRIDSDVVSKRKRPSDLAEELHKPSIRFEKQKVRLSFKDNLWGADLKDVRLIIKFSKGLWFLWWAISIYSKYAGVVPWRNKKGIPITNALRKILDESGCRPNKIWLEKGSEFCNRSLISWLQDNDIEMYPTHEGKSAIAERFIRTFSIKFTNIFEKCVYW